MQSATPGMATGATPPAGSTGVLLMTLWLMLNRPGGPTKKKQPSAAGFSVASIFPSIDAMPLDERLIELQMEGSVG